MNILPCFECIEYDKINGSCDKFGELLLSGQAMLYFSQKCGKFYTYKVSNNKI